MPNRTARSVQKYTSFSLRERLPGECSVTDGSMPVGSGINWITVPRDCAGLVYRVVEDFVIEALEIINDKVTLLTDVETTVAIANITCSDDGRMIVAACTDGSLQAFDVVPLKGIFPRWMMPAVHSFVVPNINASPSKSRDYGASAAGPIRSFDFAFMEYFFLLVDAGKRSLKIIDAATQKPQDYLEGLTTTPPIEATAAAWFPEEESEEMLSLAVGVIDGSIRICIFQKATGILEPRLRIRPPADLPQGSICTHVDWFNDGVNLAVGYCNVKVTLTKDIHEPVLYIGILTKAFHIRTWKRIEDLTFDPVPANGRHVYFTSFVTTQTDAVVLLVTTNLSSKVSVVMNESHDDWRLAKLNPGCAATTPKLPNGRHSFPLGSEVTIMPQDDGVLQQVFLVVATDGSLSRFTLTHEKVGNFYCPRSSVTLVPVDDAVGNRSRKFLDSGMVDDKPFGDATHPVGSGLNWIAVSTDCDGVAYRVSDGKTIETVEVSEDGLSSLASFAVDSAIVRLTCSANGRLIAATCIDGSLRCYDVTQNDAIKPKWKLSKVHSHVVKKLGDGTDGPLRCLSFSGNFVLLADATKEKLSIMDVTSSKPTNLVVDKIRYVRVCSADWMSGRDKMNIVLLAVGDYDGRIHFCVFHKKTYSLRLISNVPFPDASKDDAKGFQCSYLHWFKAGRHLAAGFTRKVGHGYEARLYVCGISTTIPTNEDSVLDGQTVRIKTTRWTRMEHAIQLNAANLKALPMFMTSLASFHARGESLIVGWSASSDIGIMTHSHSTSEWDEDVLKDSSSPVHTTDVDGDPTYPVGLSVTTVSEASESASLLPQSLLMVGMDGTLSRFHLEHTSEPSPVKQRAGELPASSLHSSLRLERKGVLKGPSPFKDKDRPVGSGLRWVAAPSDCIGLTYRVLGSKTIEAVEVDADGNFRVMAQVECSASICCLGCTEDGRLVAAALMDGSIYCFDVTSSGGIQERWVVLDAHSHNTDNLKEGGEGGVRCLAFKARFLLLVDSTKGKLSMFDAISRNPLNLIKEGDVEGKVLCAAWSSKACGSELELPLAVADSKGAVNLYMFNSQKREIRFERGSTFPGVDEDYGCTHLYWFNGGTNIAAGFSAVNKKGDALDGNVSSWNGVRDVLTIESAPQGVPVVYYTTSVVVGNSNTVEGTTVVFLRSNASRDIALVTKDGNGDWEWMKMKDVPTNNDPDGSIPFPLGIDVLSIPDAESECHLRRCLLFAGSDGTLTSMIPINSENDEFFKTDMPLMSRTVRKKNSSAQSSSSYGDGWSSLPGAKVPSRLVA